MDINKKSYETAERLRALRNSRKLSYESLAKQLNQKYEKQHNVHFSISSLKNYEIANPFNSKTMGKAHPTRGMRTEYLLCLSDFYGVSVDYILGTTGDAAPDLDPHPEDNDCIEVTLSYGALCSLRELDSYRSDVLNAFLQHPALPSVLECIGKYMDTAQVFASQESKDPDGSIAAACRLLESHKIATIPYCDAKHFFFEQAKDKLEGILTDLGKL